MLPVTPDQTAPVPLVPWTNRYRQLPATLMAPASPTQVANPQLLCFNSALAAELGITTADWTEDNLAAAFSGNRPLAGSDPVALAYAGHQFGNFVPQLGDGRAVLLGDVVDRAGQVQELQLKGSGPTPFSRRGDGRAALGPVLREYLVSEAMHALGIPTTRALAAVSTGEAVQREQPLPGAILTRVAPSHVRVGTFQYLAARSDTSSIRALVQFMIEGYYPALREAPVPGAALLEAVAERQVALIAQWLQVGFIHGVMNTDNMAIAGHTIDFGPCAFLETYRPLQVFSAIDTQGRYAFTNQLPLGAWNLARLAEAMLPVLGDRPEDAMAWAQELIDGLEGRSEAAWLGGMCAKLGLTLPADPSTTPRAVDPVDAALVTDLLMLLEREQADYTLSLRSLADAGPADTPPSPHPLASGAPPFAQLLQNPAAATAWLSRWHKRLHALGHPPQAVRASMLARNPLYIPRNHLVEAALQGAAEGDLRPWQALHATLAKPFEVQAGAEHHAHPAAAHERVTRTFCGT